MATGGESPGRASRQHSTGSCHSGTRADVRADTGTRTHGCRCTLGAGSPRHSPGPAAPRGTRSSFEGQRCKTTQLLAALPPNRWSWKFPYEVCRCCFPQLRVAQLVCRVMKSPLPQGKRKQAWKEPWGRSTGTTSPRIQQLEAQTARGETGTGKVCCFSRSYFSGSLQENEGK